MRSLVGLVAVIVTATFYLYLLSVFLPPGPQLPKQSHEGETTVAKDGDKPSEMETASSRCASLMLALSLFVALTAGLAL